MITRFKHTQSGEIAEVVSVRGEMVRVRWEDGIEDEYHIKRIQKLLDSGSWDVEAQH